MTSRRIVAAGYHHGSRQPARPTISSSVNLPNAITIGRIFLVPLLVVVLLTQFEGRLILGVRKELVGAAIFGLASLTDWLDGYLARRRQQVTTLGQFMDPLADKLLITAALVAGPDGLAQSWIVVGFSGGDCRHRCPPWRSRAGSRFPRPPLGNSRWSRRSPPFSC